MRRFLVVGCGGSGGATLAYMMDQLRSELLAAGVYSLPMGWQFVHIDVPSGAETGLIFGVSLIGFATWRSTGLTCCAAVNTVMARTVTMAIINPLKRILSTRYSRC